MTLRKAAASTKPGFKMERVALYQQVSRHLEQQIAAMNPGEKLPSEVELARQFGVSTITVRHALGGLLQKGLVERRQGSGTYVSGERLRTRHVAVLLDLDVSIKGLSRFYLKFLQDARRSLSLLGVENRAYLGHRQIGFEPVGITCEELMKDVRLGRVDGVIAIAVGGDDSWKAVLEKQKIPFLETFFDEAHNLRLKSHFITTAFDYLTSRGRKQVAIIGSENPIDQKRPLTLLAEKYAPQYGLKANPRFIDMGAHPWHQGMGWERFRDIWIAQPTKPDALIIADHHLFDDCQKAIEEFGIKVPDELDIVVSSSDAIDLHPRLPVLVWKLKVAELGLLCARRMKELLEGSPLSGMTELPVEVQIEGPGYTMELPLENATEPVFSSPGTPG
ncbi:MAG TPA: GntR family transcriptional regulator [Chthoniobacteraceae bacterium]|nr:GntR family transcriptional regulator [Chthoniobacteraceae bacterium]